MQARHRMHTFRAVPLIESKGFPLFLTWISRA